MSALDKVFLAAGTGFAAAKVPPAAARYRHAEAWNQRCASCCFVSPGTDGKTYCRKVEVVVDTGDGQSDPGAVCDLYGPGNGITPLSSVTEPSALARVVSKGTSDCQWCRDGLAENDSPEGLEQLFDFETHDVTEPAERVKLTPRTPEASTVPQPTVPPGGPGLFHVKGMQLPPYIQHLYKHLVARYGRQKAYGVAVGVVKKWAAGVNPGGWKTKSGKGKRTHPDVRAAAQKNVAQWEADRARAHKQSAEHEHSGGQEGVALSTFVKPFTRVEKGRRELVKGHLSSERLGRGTGYVGAHGPETYWAERGRVTENLDEGRHLAEAGDIQAFRNWAKKQFPHMGVGRMNRLYRFLGGKKLKARGDAGTAAGMTALGKVLELAVVSGVPGPPQSSMLPGATAPGARPIYEGQLKQQPMQTVAASPPLPPGVKPPTAKEIETLEKHILKHPRTVLLTGAAMQTHAAAHKMRTGDVMGALHSLRSAQSGIHSHAFNVVGEAIPKAMVFTAANPPGQQTMVQAHFQEVQRKRADIRDLHQEVSQLIDRIRRYHFHGHFGSLMQQTRWL